MNEIQPFDFRGHEVRVATDPEGKPWWVLADVCEALDIKNSSNVARRIPDQDKGVHGMDTPGGWQDLTLVNEQGLYEVIFRSSKPEAEKFRRWVFEEVLPAIRETGRYEHPATQPQGDELTLALRAALETREKQLETQQKVGELEVRIKQLEHKPARQRIDLDIVRGRFAGALRDAIRESGVTDSMTRQESATYHRGLNSDLKHVVMCGRRRDNWEWEHYERAVDWLLVRYRYDLRWIFEHADEQGAA